MKKKILIIIGVIVLIIGILALIPFLYKDKLLVKVKATINKQVNAKVDFKDFNVSLFSHFPKVGMELEQLSVVGINEFASDTMMYAKSISSAISLSELIKGENLELKSLIIDQPRINLLVNKDGKANWDIAKETGAPSTEPASDQSFKMKLNDIQVKNLNLYYGDASMPMKMWVKNTNVNSTGEVEGTLTTFDLKGDVGEIIFEYDSVKYISNTKLKAETLLKADYDKMAFTFDRGKLMINNLPLQVNGNFSMPNDSMLFDLAFQSEKSDFATILALVPADYQKYLEKATINGAAEFKGSVKGLYYNEIYPAIDLLLNVSNGSFKYQDLPESVQDIQVSAKINKPEGDMNTMVVNVDKAHASIKNNPIDMTLNLSEMVTDPNIAATFAGTIDFNTLKQAIPVDSLDLTGIMKARMQIAGRMSSVEKQEYEKFKSEGEATIQNFKVVSNKLTRPVEIRQAQVNATTNQITVGKFDGKVGESDFALTGNVSNYLPYVFKNGVLKGNFNLKSSFMNFTELSNLMKEEKPDTTKAAKAAKPAPAAPADSATAFEVPDKLDLSFQSNIQKAVYDKMPISNVNGAIKIKDRRMELSNLAMDMLQGRVVMTGLYASAVKNKPTFDFKVNMQNLDLPSAYQSLETFQRYVPLAARSQGKFSTQFGLSGAMNEKMDIVPTSLNGEGLINTLNLMIIESPIFNQIRGVIKKDKLKDVKIKDFTAKFKFENGALTLNPFQTTIADQEATIGGTLSADRQINMVMDFKVNREDLGGDINKGLGFIPGSDNIKMVDASVILKGALTKPEVSLDLSKARAQIEQEVKKATKEQVKETTKKIGDELKKLFK
jgi:hypothetical protein